MWLKSRFCVWQEPDTSDFLFSHNFNNRAPDSAINQWLHNPVPAETPTPNQSAAFLFGPVQILLMLFCVCAPSSCHNMVLYAYSVEQMYDFYSEKLPMLVSCDPNMPPCDISILGVFFFSTIINLIWQSSNDATLLVSGDKIGIWVLIKKLLTQRLIDKYNFFFFLVFHAILKLYWTVTWKTLWDALKRCYLFFKIDKIFL